MELESTRSKNENLARLNDEIKQESGQNYEKCQQLCKKMQENKELRKNELLKCNEEVKLLQERLGKANESLRVEVTDIENLEMVSAVMLVRRAVLKQLQMSTCIHILMCKILFCKIFVLCIITCQFLEIADVSIDWLLYIANFRLFVFSFATIM